MRLLLLACLVACGSSKPVPEPPAEVVTTPAPVTDPVSPGIELPEVASTGFDRADRAVAQIAASPTTLTVKGKTVVTLSDGKVDAADVQGGAVGMIIPKLREHTSDFPTAGVVLQLDRRTPYTTLLQILSTLQASKLLAVSILARSGASTVTAPIALPPSGASAWVRHTVPPDGKPAPHVQPAIALSSSELKLFSISGTAGTLAKPALVMKTNPGINLVELGKKLAELRTKYPYPDDQTMVVVADGTLPIQAVLEVIAAVRATPEGKPLYPDIVLSNAVP